MTALDVLQSPQFITIKGKRFVLLESDDWEALIEWLEDREDEAIIQEAYARLAEAKFDREKAGWMEWEKAKEMLE
jgi:PHD/YefM family antitoxin component YafN of YafNO toxin-antitoxin module